jgi:hypothetical protein
MLSRRPSSVVAVDGDARARYHDGTRHPFMARVGPRRFGTDLLNRVVRPAIGRTIPALPIETWWTMLTGLLQSHALVHLSSIIALAAVVFRDQIKLRLTLLVSLILACAHLLALSPLPDWQDLVWPVVSVLVGAVVLVQIILDRLPADLSPEEQDLFSALAGLTPGEFRALTKLATWHQAEAEATLTREGSVPASLFYVLSGDIAVEKAGRTIMATPRTFIGEIAFLHRTPASATVRVGPGTRYLEWSVEALERRIEGRQMLKQAFTRIISLDMASKVARA